MTTLPALHRPPTVTPPPPTGRSHAAPADRARGEQGVAIVEFSLVIGLLLYLVLGAISLGVLLAHRHLLQEAAVEGARAGIAAAAATDDPALVAQTTTDRVTAFLGDPDACGPGSALTCEIVVADCGGDDTGHDCIFVTLSHDREVDSLVGSLPFVEAALPDTITVSATARVD